MRVALIFSVISAILCGVSCYNFVLGNVANRVVLAHHDTIEYSPIPFIKRVKMYFYSSPNNKIIHGIQALDNLHSKSSINVTAGGVGASFVNLRLKSERGGGLSYDVGIYVQPDYL